jgi:hypothetical protein
MRWALAAETFLLKRSLRSCILPLILSPLQWV